jgi:hypothetical protein
MHGASEAPNTYRFTLTSIGIRAGPRNHIYYSGLTNYCQLNEKKSLGDDLLSRGVAPQVPSALTVLTTGFGM